MVLLVAVLFPLFLIDVILAAMTKLGLSPLGGLAALFSMFLGGMINVPVASIARDAPVDPPLRLFGLGGERAGAGGGRTVIAVNLGGCVIPCLIAAYELARLARMGTGPVAAVLAATAINTLVCYLAARPAPRIGIVMPPLVPAAAAALTALVLMQGQAPAIAFTAGVLGPLIGADLMHLRSMRHAATGMASIGGAGTFDGIVLSGVLATLLA